MHILLAPDSFKESLSAVQVAEALKEGFSQALPEATFDLLPKRVSPLGNWTFWPASRNEIC